jgi:hypothetical protein
VHPEIEDFWMEHSTISYRQSAESVDFYVFLAER